MRKIYYLSTCNTCQRIIGQIRDIASFELIDIKKEMISKTLLDQIRTRVGSYEDLFNKRSRKYQAIPVQDRPQTDSEWEDLILTDYTFLKRPIVIDDKACFIGNADNVVAAMLKHVNL